MVETNVNGARILEFENSLKVTVGVRTRLGDVSLVVPKGEDAWVEFDALDTRLKFHIIFEDLDDEKAPPKWSIRSKDDHGEVRFQNWIGKFGMAAGPLTLAVLEDQKVTMFVHGSLMGEMRVINLGFFTEKANG